MFLQKQFGFHLNLSAWRQGKGLFAPEGYIRP
jgi:hypothetical protein